MSSAIRWGDMRSANRIASPASLADWMSRRPLNVILNTARFATEALISNNLSGIGKFIMAPEGTASNTPTRRLSSPRLDRNAHSMAHLEPMRAQSYRVYGLRILAEPPA